MFTEENETKDWLFAIAVVIAVIIGFFFIRQHQEEQREAGQTSAQAAPAPREAKTTYIIEYRQSSEPMRVAPKSVYRCVVNGQQVFSDHACAADASVVEISEPNRAEAQDTSALYAPVAGQRSRVTVQSGGFSDSGSSASVDDRAAICDSIQEQIDSINARMRQKYSNWEGERFRDRLRELKAECWDRKCRWVK